MMSGEHKLGGRLVLAGKRGNQIVPADVSMDDIDAVLSYQPGNGSSRLDIEGIPERHFMPRSDDSGKWLAQRAVGSNGHIDGMAPTGKRADKVGYVDFAASHLGRRAHLKYLHRTLPRSRL